MADLLRLEAVVAGYGAKRILEGVTLEVAAGEVVALIGHNGAGKSTVLRVAFGRLPLLSGRAIVMGEALDRPAPAWLLRRGVGYVPQGSRVFPDLSVGENLELGGTLLAGRKERLESRERVHTLFPRLRERAAQPAGSLSGGERQMLALGMALMLSPRLLLLDEPSMGLAAPLVRETLERIRRICSEQGTAVLIVEQKVREVLAIADRLYVLRRGEVTYTGPAAELRADEGKLREVYL